MQRIILTSLMILTPFIAIYAAHIGLIAIGVSAHIAFALMLLVMGLMAAALIVAVDTLRNDMNSRRESAVHHSKSIPSQLDQ